MSGRQRPANPSSAEYMELTLCADPRRRVELLCQPSKLTFGGPEEPDIASPEVRIRIGRRPVIQNLRKLYKRTGRSLPEEYEIFWNHDIWLLNHSVGLIRETENQEVLSLGYELRLLDENAVITELLPQHWFVAEQDGALMCEADIRLNGRAYRPVDSGEPGSSAEDLHYGGEMTLAEDEGVVGRVSFFVMTPRIQAIGPGDLASSWLFQRAHHPLEGYQSLLEIILVDKHSSELRCEARARASLSGLNGVPVAVQSDWIPLTLELE